MAIPLLLGLAAAVAQPLPPPAHARATAQVRVQIVEGAIIDFRSARPERRPNGETRLLVQFE